MMLAIRRPLLSVAVGLSLVAPALVAQDAASRDEVRARREARRAAQTQPNGQDLSRGMAERTRAENSLREAFARAVRQRLSLSDQQTSQLVDVNRRFGDDRLKIVREEIRLRRELRQAVDGIDGNSSPATARLLDQLLDSQRQRVDLQQKEQAALSEFLTPEQRVRYIAMTEQLRRRIKVRADSARGAAGQP